MTSPNHGPNGNDHEGPVIRDKRRIDPETGEVRQGMEGTGGPAEQPAPATPTGDAAAIQAELAERTVDLQRLQAEYANYRKRVDRDRVAVRDQALANVLNEFLPVLDDIGRARDHGELTGGFAKVGEALENAVTKLGLERFGEKGESFDPMVHEALMHSHSPDVMEPTCVDILQPGYRVGGRILRAARVAVADPAPESAGVAETGEPVETAETEPEISDDDGDED